MDIAASLRWTLPAAVATLLLLAGCGSAPATLDHAALQREAEALHGLAGEGSLLAGGAARDDFIGSYLPVHAAELGDETATLATRLATPVASPTDEPARRALASEARRVEEAFRALAAGPAAAGAARAGAAFTRAAAVTDRLAAP